ncbi:MAG: CvpA family protein [Lachnospiraceae bacterium]|nr:CvpA family protein [Lachnospiraceae bacterium]
MAAGIVVAAIILISTLLGLKNGGLRTFWSIGCVVAAIVLAMILNPMISDFLKNQVHLDRYIEENVVEYMELKTYEGLNEAGVNTQAEFIKTLELPSSWKKAIIRNNTEDGRKKLSAEVFTEYISRAVAGISVNTIAFILTFILVIVILRVISMTFGIVEKIPLLKEVNKLVGLGAGFIKGLLIVWLIMIVIAFARNYSWGGMLLEQILANPFAAFFYRHNFLALLLTSVF